MAKIDYGFIYPLKSYIRITQIYWAQHLGVDFGWHDMRPEYVHQDIVSIQDGAVVYTCDGYGNTYPKSRIYGNCVIVDHGTINGERWYSLYAHLEKGSICVKTGQKVKKGQRLARMNNSGYSNGTHLHFELRRGKNLKANSIDPIDYLFIEDDSIYVNPGSKQYDRIKYRETAPVKPVQRNTRVEQIEVNLDCLRCRKTPEYKPDDNILGYVPKGYYNVIKTTDADGYKWYCIDKDRWCAEVMGVHELHPEKQHLWKVTFPKVSNGDKEQILLLAEKLELEVEEVETDG